MAQIDVNLLKNNDASTIATNFISNQANLLQNIQTANQNIQRPRTTGYSSKPLADNTQELINNAIKRNHDWITGELDQESLIKDLYSISPQTAMMYQEKFKKDANANEVNKLDLQYKDLNNQKIKQEMNYLTKNNELDNKIKEQDFKQKDIDTKTKGLENITKMLAAAETPNQIKNVLTTAQMNGYDINSLTGGAKISAMTENDLMDIKKMAFNQVLTAKEMLLNEREVNKNEMKNAIDEKELLIKEQFNKDQIAVQQGKLGIDQEQLNYNKEIGNKKLTLEEQKLEADKNRIKFQNQNDLTKTNIDIEDKLNERVVKSDEKLNSYRSTMKTFDSKIDTLDTLFKELGAPTDDNGNILKNKDGSISLDKLPKNSPLTYFYSKTGNFIPSETAKYEAMWQQLGSQEIVNAIAQVKEAGGATGAISNAENDNFKNLQGIGKFQDLINQGEVGKRKLFMAYETAIKARNELKKLSDNENIKNQQFKKQFEKASGYRQQTQEASNQIINQQEFKLSNGKTLTPEQVARFNKRMQEERGNQ